MFWNKQEPTSVVELPTHGHSISVKFPCSHCGAEVITDTIGVPDLDLVHDHTYETEDVACLICHTHHEVTVNNSVKGGDIQVTGVNKADICYQQIH